MSKKARLCKALLVLLGIGGATASKCEGPVDMYGPAVMYGVRDSTYRLMYGPAPSSYVKIAPAPEPADSTDNNVPPAQETKEK